MKADRIIQQETVSNIEYQFVKYAKLKDHSVIIQKRFIGVKALQTNTASLENLEKGKNGQYNGYMSPATRRKVKSIIENYLLAIQLNTSMAFPNEFPSMEVYPTFLTLTLPSKQLHCDKDLKEIFARFMEHLTGDRSQGKSGWNVANYIWTAETQENGNLHFHIILDRALPAKRLQEIWNNHLERLGYVTRYRNAQNYIYRKGFFVRKDMLNAAISKTKKFCKKTGKHFDFAETKKTEITRQKEAYKKGVKSNWNNPPTTKIHAIQNIKKLTAYVSKYMTKEPEIIAPPMQPGESLVNENGKYFITSTTVEHSISMEGIPLETVQEQKREVIVKFNVRVMRGRIWGASKILHSDNLNPYTVNLECFNRVNHVTTCTRAITITKQKYRYDLFGNKVADGLTNEEQYYTSSTESFDFVKQDTDAHAVRWIEFLESGYVPREDIEKATAMAGEHFQHNGGLIIPLDIPQKDLLKAYSPVLYGQYLDYYKNLFSTIYPVAS